MAQQPRAGAVLPLPREDTMHSHQELYGPPLIAASESSLDIPYDFESAAFRTRTFLRVARRALAWQSVALVFGTAEVCLASLWRPWPHLVGLGFGAFLIVVSAGRIYYLHRTFEIGARPSYDSVSRPLLRPAARGAGGYRKRGQRLFDMLETLAILATVVLLLINVIARIKPPPAPSFPVDCSSDNGCYRVADENDRFPDAPAPPVWRNTTIACAGRAVRRRLQGWLGEPEELDVVGTADSPVAWTYHYVTVPAGFGFPDDVYIHFKCADSGVQLEFHSQTRLAHPDFGVNQRRVLWLAKKLGNPKWDAEEQNDCREQTCGARPARP